MGVASERENLKPLVNKMEAARTVVYAASRAWQTAWAGSPGGLRASRARKRSDALAATCDGTV